MDVQKIKRDLSEIIKAIESDLNSTYRSIDRDRKRIEKIKEDIEDSEQLASEIKDNLISKQREYIELIGGGEENYHGSKCYNEIKKDVKSGA